MEINGKELIEKAKQTKSIEELAALAATCHITLTETELQQYYDKLHQESGEISDDEIENITGGGCGDGSAEAMQALSRHGVISW